MPDHLEPVFSARTGFTDLPVIYTTYGDHVRAFQLGRLGADLIWLGVRQTRPLSARGSSAIARLTVGEARVLAEQLLFLVASHGRSGVSVVPSPTCDLL